MLSLREFEASIIARYLTTRDKLLKIAYLNKKWHALVFKHYSWASFPTRGPKCILSDYMKFFDKFSEVTGIIIPDFPGQLLSE